MKTADTSAAAGARAWGGNSGNVVAVHLHAAKKSDDFLLKQNENDDRRFLKIPM